MTSYRLGNYDIFTTAHQVLKEVFEDINAKTAIPVVHNPGLEYEEAVSHYREQVDDRYADQVGEGAIVTPTLIGWKRESMDWPDGVGEKNAIQHLRCPEYDDDGVATGNMIPWIAVKVTMDMQFRLYSTDARLVDAFEVGYLSKTFVSDINSVNIFMDDRNSSEDYILTWDFKVNSLDYVKDENQYITYDFACKMTGNMLVRQDTSTLAGSVAKGIGTDGKSKQVRHIAETYDPNANLGKQLLYPNHNPKSNSAKIYEGVVDSDLNLELMKYFSK